MTASTRIFGTRNLRSINVKIPNDSSVEESMLYIEQILRVAHDIGPGQQNDSGLMIGANMLIYKDKQQPYLQHY